MMTDRNLVIGVRGWSFQAPPIIHRVVTRIYAYIHTLILHSQTIPTKT